MVYLKVWRESCYPTSAPNWRSHAVQILLDESDSVAISVWYILDRVNFWLGLRTRRSTHGGSAGRIWKIWKQWWNTVSNLKAEKQVRRRQVKFWGQLWKAKKDILFVKGLHGFYASFMPDQVSGIGGGRGKWRFLNNSILLEEDMNL